MPRPLECQVRLPIKAVGSELFTDDLPHYIQRRTTMYVLNERIVDECLVVTSTFRFYQIPEVLQDRVIQSN